MTEKPICDWRFTGATTASDGFQCTTCDARMEVQPGDHPSKHGCADPNGTMTGLKAVLTRNR